MSFCSTSVAQTVSRYMYNSELPRLSKIMNTLIVLMFSIHTQADSRVPTEVTHTLGQNIAV